MHLDNVNQLQDLCVADLRGLSNCYAAVIFNDSPLSAGVNGVNKTWNYTIQIDLVRDDYSENTQIGTNNVQVYYLPVQLAVNNAITNSTDVPYEYMFSRFAEPDFKITREIKTSDFMTQITQTIAIVFFISVLPSIYHVVSVISSERESGMSALIDAMGGSPVARILSYVASFSIVYLPCWIIFGVRK